MRAIAATVLAITLLLGAGCMDVTEPETMDEDRLWISAHEGHIQSVEIGRAKDGQVRLSGKFKRDAPEPQLYGSYRWICWVSESELPQIRDTLDLYSVPWKE